MARKVMGRVRFLALRETVEAELGRGLFKKSVYNKYEAQLGFSYRQFLYYVREFDLGFKRAQDGFARASPRPQSPARSGQPASQSSTTTAIAAGREPINARPAPPRKFIFNPADIDPNTLI